MKKIKKGKAIKFQLDQVIADEESVIFLTVIGENGNPLIDSEGNSLEELELALSEDGKFETAEITIPATTPDQYIRLLFESDDVEIESKYAPEDAKLVNAVNLSLQAEIIPVSYFTDYFLKMRAQLDIAYQQAVDAYLLDLDAVRNALISAQADLEADCELYFTERTVNEERDNYFEHFNGNFWQVQVYNPPITELVSFKLKYGGNEIADIGLDLFVVNKPMGIIEFLPIPTDSTSGLYTMLMHSISGAGVGILSGAIYDRIPSFFHFSYKSGIWTTADSVLKEGLRSAIARRAMINLVDNIDPAARKASESESSDGVSASVSYNADKVVERMKKEEEKWIANLKRKFGRDMNIAM